MKAQTVIDTILGEAAYGTQAQRYDDMLGIASVIANRSVALGVTPQSVVAAPGQFDAFGKSLPAGVEAFRSLAEDAYNTIQTIGPITSATFYATPAATGNLPGGLKEVGRTTGHVFHEDPMGRAIATAEGYKTPDLGKLAAMTVNVPTPSPAPRGEQTIASPQQASLGVGGSTSIAPAAPTNNTSGMFAGLAMPATGVQTSSFNPSTAGMVGDPTSQFGVFGQNQGFGLAPFSPTTLGGTGLGHGYSAGQLAGSARGSMMSPHGTGSTHSTGLLGFDFGAPLGNWSKTRAYSEDPDPVTRGNRAESMAFGSPPAGTVHSPSFSPTASTAAFVDPTGRFDAGPISSSVASIYSPESYFSAPAQMQTAAATPAPAAAASAAQRGPTASSFAPAGGSGRGAMPTSTPAGSINPSLTAAVGAPVQSVKSISYTPTAVPAAPPTAPATPAPSYMSFMSPAFSPALTAPAMNPAVAPRSVQTTAVNPARAPAPAPAPAPARGPAIAAPQQKSATTIAAAQPAQSRAATGPAAGLRGAMGGHNLATRGAYAAAGAMIGGLPGALIGGLLGPSLAKGLGGLLGTGYPALGPTGIGYTAGLGFPAAPPGGTGNPYSSNNSPEAMAAISPAAAAAVSQGRAGLY